MKKQLICFATLLLTGVVTTFGQVGIGTENPDPSSILDLTSTEKGFLPPRMAESERDVINNLAEGLVIYNTDKNCLEFWNSTKWVSICEAAAPASAVFTVSSPSYQGISVIDATGIGYNGEEVPAASTITVQANVTTVGPYTLTATHSGTGLVYSATGTFASAGSHPVVLTPNTVTIDTYTVGELTMSLIGANNTLNLKPRIDYKSLPTAETLPQSVEFAGYTWMDRNLGAHRPAKTADDVFSYGNYFQWGRPADGHEIVVRNGSNPSNGRGLHPNTALGAFANSDTPGHNNFIRTNSAPNDWRKPQNNNLWKNGLNNPCPTGYRLPTKTELAAALAKFDGKNIAGAFASDLKLPSAGDRGSTNGSLFGQGTFGFYWSSTITGTNAHSLRFNNSADIHYNVRGHGYSVRCIKE